MLLNQIYATCSTGNGKTTYVHKMLNWARYTQAANCEKQAVGEHNAKLDFSDSYYVNCITVARIFKWRVSVIKISDCRNSRRFLNQVINVSLIEEYEIPLRQCNFQFNPLHAQS